MVDSPPETPCPKKPPFETRLDRFVAQNVNAALADAAAGPSQMPCWARDQFWYLSPPKMADHIRQVLLRIRRLVRRPRPAR
ncbi:MAG: hypothetical protein AAF589_08080 [Planctomycetota bacterium]